MEYTNTTRYRKVILRHSYSHLLTDYEQLIVAKSPVCACCSVLVVITKKGIVAAESCEF